MKKLLIVSHTPHVTYEGSSYGWGPTVKEINFLSKYFLIEHIAPVHRMKEVPKSYLQVANEVRLIPTRDRGGKTILAKFRVVVDSFEYTYLILKRLRYCDMVHVRCPSNISLIALIVLIFFRKKPKWIKYAGDWHPKKDFLSYWLQRFLIKKFIGNQVATINDTEERSSSIFHSFNPSYSLQEVKETVILGKPNLREQINILFVGSLSKNKGVDILIGAIRSLSDDLHKKVNLTVQIIGDGPELDELKELTKRLHLDAVVRFEGWKSGNELKDYYLHAHVVVLPSRGEGWPKVVSEAMVHGVVPIVSDVSSIKKILKGFEVGTVVESFLPNEYSEAIRAYALNPDRWAAESSKAMITATNFTYEHWATRLFTLFEKHLSVKVVTTLTEQGGREIQ
jgi:glycosyltransferase involved in cell wall biosynthesis